MEQFASWSSLLEFATLSMIVYTVVTFTKELPLISIFSTKYYSWFIAFILILLSNLHAGTFLLWDIVLYLISSIFISLSANGMADFNNKQTTNTDKK